MKYRTYQVPYGFVTINTETEQPPVDWFLWFDVSDEEAAAIESGANPVVTDGQLVVGE